MAETRIKIARLEQEFDSLNSVMKSGKVKAGDTILLLTDVVIDELTVIDKNCFIDLCEHFIFVTLAGGLTVKGGVSVTFDNGSIQTLSDTQIEDAVISQGSKTSVMFGPHLYVETNGTSIHARKRGGVIIDGTVIKTIGDQCAVLVDDAFSSVEINDGVITSFLNSALSVRNGGSAIINGGTLSTESSANIPEEVRSAIIVNGDSSKVIINDGNIFANNTVAIKELASSYVEINGGQICNKNSTWPTVELSDTSTAFKMTGGHVYSTGSYALMSTVTEIGSTPVVEVTGGKVGSGTEVVLTVTKGDTGVEFSGGSVKGYLKKKYLKEGYVVSDIKDEEGYAEIVLKALEGDDDDDDESEDNANEVISVSPSVSGRLLPDSPEDTLPKPQESVADLSYLPDSPEVVVPEVYELPSEHLPNIEPIEESEKESSDSKTHDHESLKNISIVIRRKIYIYRVPSKQFKMAEWSGVLNIIDCKHYDADGHEFAFVSFKLPGSGKFSTGYVLVDDILD